MEQTMPLKDWVRKVLYIIAIAKKDKDIIYNPEKLTKDFSYLVRKYHGDGIDPPRAARKILNWAEKKGEGEMPEEPSYEPQDEKGIFESKICQMIDEEANTVIDSPEENEGTISADELLMYLENDGDLYTRWFTPIVKNLVRKQAAGRYDHFLAIKGFLYLVDAAAKKYTQEFEEGQIWNKVFPKNVRIEVAKKLVSEFEYDFEDGQYSDFIPKKYQVKKEESKLEEDENIKENDKQMKITKESLLKIIREEIEKVIKEEPIESNPQYGKEEDFSETPDETNTPLKEDKEELEEEEVRGKGEEDYSEVDHLVAEKKEKLKEETPPGRESQVKALKKELPKTYIDKKSDERKESNPWAVSWSSYQKSKKE